MRKSWVGAFVAVGISAIAAQSAAAQDSPWQVRVRALGVLPDEGAELSTGGTPIEGSVTIEDQYVPEVDVTYFFTDNLAVELIAAVTPHEVSTVKTTVGDVLTNASVDLGDVWLLPPTLTAQYHFHLNDRVKPYIGAGINVTFFFAEDEGATADGIDYDPSVGPAIQAGLDFDLDGKPGGWLVNLDVKKVWINSDVEVDLSSALGPALGVDEVIVDADVDINPLIVGVGLGYRF
ncbi:MAG: OmpW family outer membrane protein [Pseudomonadota bacterium]